MADKRGALAHKPDCQCRFCRRRRAKEAANPAAPPVVAPEAPDVIKETPPAQSPTAMTEPTPQKEGDKTAEEGKTTEAPAIPHDNLLKRLSGKQVGLTLLGAILIVAGLGYGSVWYTTYRAAENQNVVGVLPAIGLIVGGFWLVAQQRAAGLFTKSDVMMLGGKRIEVPKEQVNSLNIYPNRVVFENTKEPEGQPWRWRADGRSYYVNKWDEKEKKLVPFDLPDQSFYDPRAFAERVLELPAHQKVMRRREKMIEQLRPLMIGGMILVVGILQVMTTG